MKENILPFVAKNPTNSEWSETHHFVLFSKNEMVDFLFTIKSPYIVLREGKYNTE